eukprot:928676_1
MPCDGSLIKLSNGLQFPDINSNSTGGHNAAVSAGMCKSYSAGNLQLVPRPERWTSKGETRNVKFRNLKHPNKFPFRPLGEIRKQADEYCLGSSKIRNIKLRQRRQTLYQPERTLRSVMSVGPTLGVSINHADAAGLRSLDASHRPISRMRGVRDAGRVFGLSNIQMIPDDIFLGFRQKTPNVTSRTMARRHMKEWQTSIEEGTRRRRPVPRISRRPIGRAEGARRSSVVAHIMLKEEREGLDRMKTP